MVELDSEVLWLVVVLPPLHASYWSRRFLGAKN